MRTKLTVALTSTLIILLAVFWTQSSKKSINQAPVDIVKSKKLPKHEKEALRNYHELLKTKDVELGFAPRERLVAARKFMEKKQKSLIEKAAIPLDWEERGPDNIGGRTRAILVDANDASGKTVFAGGVAGGLWKTTDITVSQPSWTAINDMFSNLAVTCISQDPTDSDIMYFGTGEGWFNFDAVRGEGVWKSTDGGSTWSQLSATDNSNFRYIQDILVDNSGNVYAATRGNGLYKSTNGGNSWNQVLGAGNGSSQDRVADIELAANDDIYVAIGIFNVDGIYKSTNATHGSNTGNSGNWTKLTLPDNHDRIDIACAPSNDQFVYAICQNENGNNIDAIYKSEDGGSTWSSKTIPGNLGSQAWYDLIIAVDPNDEETVYCGGVRSNKSTNGGNSWSSLTGIHVDMHQIIFVNGDSDKGIWGCDGGIYYSDNLTTGEDFDDRNKSYNVTQYYACAIHPELGENYFLGGTQDNGSHIFQSPGINSVTYAAGGDGAFCHIDTDNPDIQMTAFQNNDHRVTNNGWSTSTGVNFASTGYFINPTDYDSESNILYGSYTDGTYCMIKGVGSTNTTDTESPAAFPNRKVTALHVSENTSDRVFMALYGDDVYIVDNADNSPTVTSLNFPIPSGGSYISSIDVEVGDDDHILVTISNYGQASVWETINGGTTWTNVEGNLPDFPVRWGMFDPTDSDKAILATELGVWSTTNLDGSSTDWDPSNTNLANVRCDMLQYRPSDNTIIVATHGRGIFSTTSLLETKVNFNEVSSTQTESSDSGIVGCTGYVDISIPVSITADPSSDVTATFSITGGTANNLEDFQLLTSVLVFTPGGTLEQNILVRVFNDAIIEGNIDESIIISLDAGSETGVNSTHTVAIVDNDEDPETASAPTYILDQDFESGTSLSGIGWANLHFSGDSGANDYIIGSNGSMSGSNSCYVSDGASALNYDKGATTDILLRSSLIDATGLSDLSLDFDFKIDGEVGDDYGRLYYSTNGTTYFWIEGNSSGPYVDQATSTNRSISLPIDVEDDEFYIGWRFSSNNDNQGSNPPMTIDEVKVSYEDVVVSESQLTSVEAEVGPNQDVVFYNGNDIVARINNLSSHDFGCVTVEIDNSASGSTPWINGFNRSNKTFLVTATNNDPSAIYELTLYIDDSWLPEWTDVNLIKSSGSIPDSDQNNSEVFEAEFSNFGSTDSYKGVFFGFSGFAFTDAPVGVVPVELVSFDAYLEKDDVLLEWFTNSELNNDYFLIERSRDGKNFSELTKVTGMGTSFELNSYKGIDTSPYPGINYYRLSQVDYNGQKTELGIRSINYLAESKIEVFPNPVVGNSIKLKMTGFESSDYKYSITDNAGNLIQNGSGSTINGNNSIQLDDFQPGIYYLILETNNNRLIEKILKI